MLRFFKRRPVPVIAPAPADAAAYVAKRLQDPSLTRGQRIALKWLYGHLAPLEWVTPWSEAARKR